MTDIDHKNYTSDSFIFLENAFLESEKSVTLLGVFVNNKLSFNDFTRLLLKEGNKRFHALRRIEKYLNFDKKRLIMKAFIDSQFNNCPLLWMFHSREMNNKINRLQERALRIVYNNYTTGVGTIKCTGTMHFWVLSIF